MNRGTNATKKTTLLRQLLAAPRPTLLAGAHNGLSARMVEEVGFDGIWASGFEISAAHGTPDADLLTRTEFLTAARVMDEASGLPVIADCDTGFGNAINVMRTISEYERAGIAGICIEDNVFPKRCSFYDSAARRLEPIEEFAAKVRAAKHAQRDPDFLVIARTEALIAGLSVDEAVKRVRSYADAGADMCLIHSKSSRPDEVIAAAQQWDRPQPLACVPTTYATTTATTLHEAGFKLIIYANQGLRGALAGMRQALTAVRKGEFAAAANGLMSSMEDVYGLVGVPELLRLEGEYVGAKPVERGARGGASAGSGDKP